MPLGAQVSQGGQPPPSVFLRTTIVPLFASTRSHTHPAGVARKAHGHGGHQHGVIKAQLPHPHPPLSSTACPSPLEQHRPPCTQPGPVLHKHRCADELQPVRPSIG